MNRSDFFKVAAKLLYKNGFELLVEGPLEALDAMVGEEAVAASTIERPPGATVDDIRFKQLCTGCDACMAACPVNVIMIDDLKLRYPLIYPEKDPCIHCEGLPCISSCPTGALSIENLAI